MPPKRLFLFILILYLALALAYSVAIPLAEAPDEADHYAYIVYLGQNRRLPEGPAVTQGKHPPLYHATAAALTAWTGLDFTFLRSNPDALPLGPDKPPNFFVHTTLEDFPWRGGALAMHLARFLSILWGAVTVWAAWRLGNEVFPQRPSIGLIAAAFLAGLPGFLFISGSINNDNAAGAFGALSLLLCALTLRRGLRWRWSLLLGVGLGLGLLSKVGTLALWPLALLAVGGAWWLSGARQQTLWRALGHVALIYATALFLASPWLLRNWRLYGDPLAWDLVRATVDQRTAPLTWGDIGWLLQGFHTSFWGRFAAAGQVVLPAWAFALALVCTAIGVAGGVWYVANSGRQASGETQGHEDLGSDDFSRPGAGERLKSLLPRGARFGHAQQMASTPDQCVRFWLLLTLITVAPILVFFSVVRYSAIALGTDQVRLMWPALAALAVWVGVGVLGVTDWVRGQRGEGGKGGKAGTGIQNRAVVVGVAGGMAVFALAVLLGVIHPAFAPPQPLASADSSTKALAGFAGLELVGVDLPTQPLAMGEPAPIRLLWRATAPLPDDLRPALRLVHADGWLAVEWSHSPAGGRHSTDHWRAGEVYADDYLLTPSPATAGTYTVAVAVRPFGGDWIEPTTQQQRLPIDPDTPGTPFVVIGAIELRSSVAP